LVVWIGARSGIHVLRDGMLESRGLDGEDISAVHASGDAILAGSYEHGLFRSADGGASWSRVEAGLTASTIRCLEPEPGGALFAGTEPARIFRSGDGGANWSELDGITRIDGHERWFLPYSPRAGALRNIYATPGRLFASVEVGGLLQSDDGGASWTLSPVIADEDIHFVTGHPERPELLYAALGTASLSGRGEQLGGVARSHDGGATWEKVETDYTRAVIVPPSRPDLLLAAPAPRVGRDGRIVVSADGGDSWQPASEGVDTPMLDMVERFVPAPDGAVWAVCSGGRLLRATPGEWRWESTLPPAVQARSLAFAGS
jgi:photosystem II stability/assembly factor-like uncharacterized protein